MGTRKYLSQGMSYNPRQKQALEEWNEAREEYSRESALFQRAKNKLPLREVRGAFEQALFETVRLRYSQASKKFFAARCKFNNLLEPPIQVAASDPEALQKAAQAFIDVLTGVAPSAVAVGKVEQEHAQKRALYGSIEDNPQLKAIADAVRERNARSAGNIKAVEATETIETVETEALSDDISIDLPTDGSLDFLKEPSL